jgi:alkaline phosphatase D
VGTGSFATAPAPGTLTNFKVLVASCMDLSDSRTQPAWATDAARACDFALLLGDTAYANTTDRSMQWAEHLQQRAVPSFRDLIASKPTFAMWDDHDFGPNNTTGRRVGDRDRDESRDTFRELFPNRLYANANGGNYFKLTWGVVDFFVLDNRYYADKNNAQGNELLGSTQWNWLANALEASTAKFKILTTGITLSDPSASESWAGYYPGQLARLAALARQHAGMLVLSGDIHKCKVVTHSGVIGGDPLAILRYPLYEVVSSGVGKYTEARGSDDGHWDHAFAVLNFNVTGNTDQVTVKLYKHDGSERSERTILQSTLVP